MTMLKPKPGRLQSTTAKIVAWLLFLSASWGCSTPAVRGTIFYQGERIDRVVPADPVISFKDGQVRYRQGEFFIDRLAPGLHWMQIRIPSDKSTSAAFGGDYYSGFEFGKIENVTAVLRVNLMRVIHLTAPVDNAVTLKEIDVDCMDLPAYPAPLKFAWDAIGNDVYYDYEIVRVRCPFTQVQIMSFGTTQETSIVPVFPRSSDKEFYLLRLDARKNGLPAGYLMMKGTGGTDAWDFRFRIVD